MMRIKFPRSLVIALAAVSLSLLFEGAQARNAGKRAAPAREARVLGVLQGDQKEALSAPATVRVGEDFKVTVKTFGSGCERQGDEGVILGEDRATIMIYDFTAATRPGVVCTMIAKSFAHTVTLRFSKPGEAVIRVWARRGSDDGSPEGVPVVLVHRVTVKPR